MPIAVFVPGSKLRNKRNKEIAMKGKPYLYAAALALALAAALGLSTSITQADPPSRPKVPALQYDPTFPKLPLPVARPCEPTCNSSEGRDERKPGVEDTGEDTRHEAR